MKRWRVYVYDNFEERLVSDELFDTKEEALEHFEDTEIDEDTEYSVMSLGIL
jgi:hypothetical protein